MSWISSHTAFKMKKILLLILFGLRLTLGAQNITPVWSSTEETDGGTGPNTNTPLVLIDSFHNPIVCGETYAPGPVLGFVTTKYDPQGNKLWQRRHDTFATDYITSAATDREGSVYVAGNTIQDPFGGAGNQIVIKYSADGDTLWQWYFHCEQGPGLGINAVHLDSAQNLLVFGTYFDTAATRVGLLAVKIAPNGSTIWSAAHHEQNMGFVGRKVRWLSDRWVFWGGASGSSIGGTRMLAWQFNDDGQTLSAVPSALYTDGYLGLMHIDHSGNLYLKKSKEYGVVKYSLAALPEWEYVIPTDTFPPGVVEFRLEFAESDEQGNVYFPGFVRLDSVTIRPFMTKLSPEGELLWEHDIVINGSTNNYPLTLAWISNGWLMMGGVKSTSIDSNFYEIVFTAYDSNGFVQGGLSDLEGRRNWITSIAPDGEHMYAAGVSAPDNFLDIDKQLLCKYALSDLVSTSSPSGSSLGAKKMSLWPNPFKQGCRAMLDHEGKHENALLQIHDSQGQIIVRRHITVLRGLQFIDLEFSSSLSVGMYNVLISTSETAYRARAVKLE